jgi:hypothetical protein
MSKTLEELSALRASGVNIAPEAEIAAKRAARAEKKAREEKENVINTLFPTHQKTTDLLWDLRNNVRNFRKNAVEKGVTKVNLPDEWKRMISIAFTRLDHGTYRDVLWSLTTECLKVQDREIKCLAYDTADRWISEGKTDFGWILGMLSRKYVSRYGWALLRKHVKTLAPIGSVLLKDIFTEWSNDPDTQAKWNRLASEDGLPADMNELYARYARK